MKKQNEKSVRLRYIRILEKFLTRSVALLKNDDFDLNNFKNNVDRYYEEIGKVEAVRLDNEYLKKLVEFVNLTLQKVEVHSDDFESEKQLLLKEANLLHKEKNKSNYKKDKHRKKSFNDGY
jgi:V8-like Glu-specific endopeptidase